jgi:PAS domain S-box-containing protein
VTGVQTCALPIWTFLNPAWTQITGFALEDSLGAPCLDYVHPEDRRRNFELFVSLIRGEQDQCRHEVRYLHKMGGFRWLEAYARLSLDSAGATLGVAGTLNDITARRNAEAELRHQADELRGRNAELERFNLAAVGRELDMIELKQQVNALSQELGRPPPFSLAFLDELDAAAALDGERG